MTWMQIGSVAAAAVVGLWPQLRMLTSVIPSPLQRGPSYKDAISNLALVRKRLLDTDTLGDDQKEAIDTLTLALVVGSDK